MGFDNLSLPSFLLHLPHYDTSTVLDSNVLFSTITIYNHSPAREIAILLRKSFLSLIAVFLVDSTFLQGMAALFVMMLAFILQALWRPYAHDKINWVENLGLICSGLTVFLGLVISGENVLLKYVSQSATDTLKTLISIVVIGTNVPWVLFNSYYVFSNLKENLETYVFRKLPCTRGRYEVKTVRMANPMDKQITHESEEDKFIREWKKGADDHVSYMESVRKGLIKLDDSF